MRVVKAAGRILHIWLHRLWKPVKCYFHSARKLGPFYVSTWDWEAQHMTCCELSYAKYGPWTNAQEPLAGNNSAAVAYPAGRSEPKAAAGAEPVVVRLTGC